MTGAFFGHFKIIAALGVAVTLVGCEDGQGPIFGNQEKTDEGSPTISAEQPAVEVAGVEREIEKPDVFSANEPALWDGRPSLGGVWVAASGVKDPERVIIRNLENGKSVVGALFRRERENPGPRLQLSSDAAIELGILAGAPTKISVVALRTEVVVPIAPPTPKPAPVEAPVVEEAAAEVTPDPVTEDAAVQAPSGPSDPLVFAPEPEPSGSPSSMPTFFNRNGSTDGNNASNGFASPLGADADGTAVETSDVTTQTLDPIEAAEAALARSDAETSQARTRPTPVLTAVPQASTLLAKPYIQIGIFTVEDNANTTSSKLKDAGVLPVVLKQQSAGRTIWRVIVGPARTKSEGRTLQKKARDLGYTDAYFVTD